MSDISSVETHTEDQVSPLFVFLALGGFWLMLGVAGYFALG